MSDLRAMMLAMQIDRQDVFLPQEAYTMYSHRPQ